MGVASDTLHHKGTLGAPVVRGILEHRGQKLAQDTDHSIEMKVTTIILDNIYWHTCQVIYIHHDTHPKTIL